MDIVRPADMVDHIKELSDGGELLNDENLMSMCWACHAKKTQREKERRL
jgi:5-methylcytosine-specific restriction endonuclease McrA